MAEVAHLRMRIRRQLNRFTKQELVVDVAPSDALHIEVSYDDARKVTKMHLIDALMDHIQVENLQEVLAKIELLYARLRPACKMWHVFEINTSRDGPIPRTTKEFRERLLRYLSLSRYDVTAFCQTHQDGLWTHVNLLDLSAVRRDKDSYVVLVYYPKMLCVLFCNMKVVLLPVFKRALAMMFNYAEVKIPSLSSRNMGTIMHLICKKRGMDIDSDEAVPQIVRSQLREREVRVRQDMPNIIDLDHEELLQEERYLQEKYGPFEQPPIESLTYSVDGILNWEETMGVQGEDDIQFKCKVTLQGTNVLEGVRVLVENGKASVQMPHYMGDITRLGMNRMALRQRNAPNQQDT